jgi:hypothetical protein
MVIDANAVFDDSGGRGSRHGEDHARHQHIAHVQLLAASRFISTGDA